MKKLSILLMLFFSISLFSQEQTETKLRKQFGFDANSFNHLLPLNNDVGLRAPFLLHYNKFTDEHKYKIYGLNINLGGTLRNLESSTNNHNFAMNLDLKFGRGKVFDQWKSLYFHRGINHRISIDFDYVVIPEYSKGADDGRSTSNRSIGYNVGPFVGLEYRITDRFSIYTQLSYMVGLSGNSRYHKDKANGFRSYTDNFVSFREFFSLPTWVVLYYSF